MRACVWLVLAATAATAADLPSKLPAPPAGTQWKLVWHDEFSGTRIDPAKWELPDQPRRDHRWSPDYAKLDGKGTLILRTGTRDGKFFSPCLRTRGRYDKAFGYFETRCRLTSEAGHWSAFWLYSDRVPKVGDDGRDGTEIDIFEWPWRDGRVQHTLHWDGYGKEHRSAGHVSKPPGILNGGWHVFGLWWSADTYIFYVDGVETWRTNAGGVCQQPLYLKWSVEIGPWAGDIRKARLPADTLVDYVRVFDPVKR